MSDDFRKSTYSHPDGGCIEVGTIGHGILVRDTKDRAGAVLTFAPDAWLTFIDGFRAATN